MRKARQGRRWAAAAAALLTVGLVGAPAGKPWVVPVSLRVDAVEAVLEPGDRASRYAFEGAVSGLLALPGAKDEVRLLLAHDRPAPSGAGKSEGSGAFLSEWRIGIHRDAQGLTLYPRSGKDYLRRLLLPKKEKRSPEGAALDGLAAPFLVPGSGEVLLLGERRGGRVLEARGGEARILSGLGRWPREGLALLSGGDPSPILSLGAGAEGEGGRVFLHLPPSRSSDGAVEAAGGALYALELEGGIGEEALRSKDRRVRFRWVLLSGPPTGFESAGRVPGTAFSSPRSALLDSRNPGVLYFLDGGDERRERSGRTVNHNGRLYRLAFDAASNPLAGGVVEVLLAGTEGPAGPSCLASLPDGSLLLGEAPAFPLPGREASLWRLDPATGDLVRLLEVSPAAAGSGAEPGEGGIQSVADASRFLGGGWIFVVVGGPAFGAAGGESQILAVHLQ